MDYVLLVLSNTQQVDIDPSMYSCGSIFAGSINTWIYIILLLVLSKYLKNPKYKQRANPKVIKELSKNTSPTELLRKKYSVYDLIQAGLSIEDLLEQGVSAEFMRNAGISSRAIERAELALSKKKKSEIADTGEADTP